MAVSSLTDSDLRVFLRWCAAEMLDPLAVVRADVERYVRWLQDEGCYQPSTVSRRLSVVTVFFPRLRHRPDRAAVAR